MKMSILSIVYLVLILFACLSGVQGQNATISGQNASNVAPASTEGATPSAHLSVPPENAGINSLWVKGATGLTQSTVVPSAGGNVTLLAVSPTGGNGNINFADSNGVTYTYNNFFYPNGNLTFYADTPGRHILSFYTDGKLSNSATIDVGIHTPLSIQHLITRYFPAIQYPGLYLQQQ
jgi:hypothetical protein